MFNLTADSLNLSARVIDPFNTPPLPTDVHVDPDFPVVVEIEPVVALFRSGFEPGQVGNGNLRFFGTYRIEVHTVDLECTSNTSDLRLYKSPHGSPTFKDITSELASGSIRARGRGGAFSRFLLVHDQRPPLFEGQALIAQEKLNHLFNRLSQANISSGGLVSSLAAMLAQVDADLDVSNFDAAITHLDEFIAAVQSNAGGAIANQWQADLTLANDAGKLRGYARTLRFSLKLADGELTCLAPSI